MLRECPAYEANEVFIGIALCKLGCAASHDMMRIEFAWRSDASLIQLDAIAGVMIAKLTARGFDAALGNAVKPGIQRPLPEAKT